jgi:hypothetical protein
VDLASVMAQAGAILREYINAINRASVDGPRDWARSPPVTEIFPKVFLGESGYLESVLDKCPLPAGWPWGFDPKVVITLNARRTDNGTTCIKYEMLRDKVHLNVPMVDCAEMLPELIQNMDAIKRVFSEAIVSGDVTLVHCEKGSSRSAAALILAIVELAQLSFVEVHRAVRIQRAVVPPLWKTYPLTSSPVPRRLLLYVAWKYTEERLLAELPFFKAVSLE